MILRLSGFPVFVAVAVATMFGAVAASAWGGWWHATWIIGGIALLLSVARDYPRDNRRKGMW